MNDEANNTNAADDSEQTAKAAYKAEMKKLQTEDFEIDLEVAKQVDALVKQLYELCQKHQIPMVVAAAMQANGKDVGYTIAQSYDKIERVPCLLGLVSRVLSVPFLSHEEIEEVTDDITARGDKALEEMDPMELFIRAFGR